MQDFATEDCLEKGLPSMAYVPRASHEVEQALALGMFAKYSVVNECACRFESFSGYNPKNRTGYDQILRPFIHWNIIVEIFTMSYQIFEKTVGLNWKYLKYIISIVNILQYFANINVSFQMLLIIYFYLYFQRLELVESLNSIYILYISKMRRPGYWCNVFKKIA